MSNRWEVAKTVWPYMISIGLAYFVTLCLFPGIESEVPSCRLLSWMPVILIGIFNLCDFIGKVRTPFRLVRQAQTSPQEPDFTSRVVTGIAKKGLSLLF